MSEHFQHTLPTDNAPTPNMRRYFRLTLVQVKGETPKTYYYCGDFRSSGWFYGQRVNRETGEAIASMDYIDKDGVNRVTYELIDPSAIKASAEYYPDLRYGGLTRKTREQQKKEYGF